MVKILVTGAKGQLGLEINEVAKSLVDYSFDFVDSKSLNISLKSDVVNYFKNNNYDYCINCAAYTAVDKCEDEKEQSELVNYKGVSIIADACKNFNVVLIHISTDFVFDGKKNEAYIEVDKTNPINFYGASKLKGELAVQDQLQKYFIISYLFHIYYILFPSY